MASFDFSFPAIEAGTTFILGSWVCVAKGSGGFSSRLVNPTSTKAPQQEQLGEITSTEILLPEIAREVKNLSLSDTTSALLPFGLGNSTASFTALLQKNMIRTRTAPWFDSYPDSLNLTILAMPQS